MYLEKKAFDYTAEILNSDGFDYVFQDIILKNGVFGDVVDKDGILDGERGLIDGTPYRTIETDQIDDGTFAIDAFLYAEQGKDLIRETKTASTWKVGIVTRAKGAGTSIEMKTLIPQIDTV